MPNVPNVPGVPALSSYGGVSPPLLFADTALVIARALQPQWGIYTTDGRQVIASSLAALVGLGSLASAVSSVFGSLTGAVNSISQQLIGQNVANLFSVVDFDFKQDWNISDYPVEQGGFQSYDKVQMPFDLRMRVAAGGSQANRQALLDTVAGIANSTELYTVYTPEETYFSCNVAHYDYSRKANSGVGLIIVDIWLTEIRVTATTAFSNTTQPGLAGQQALGTVQPTPYTGPGIPFGAGGIR